MSNSRKVRISVVLLSVAWLGGCGEGTGDQPAMESAPAAPAAPAPGSPEAKIQDAMSAAPADIARDASIMDWPAEEGAAPATLREGSNGWTCFPTSPAAAGRGGLDPMCLDSSFMVWAQAYMTRGTPDLPGVGFGYMLSGDAGASNIDPFATGPTPDNDWVVVGPHVMMVVPDPVQLEGTPTAHGSGPFVMWKGTPYAHVMMPVARSR